MIIDERRQRRSRVTSYLRICYKDNGHELGRVVDISPEGMGLCGVEPIQTDRTLTCSLTLPAASRATGEVVFDAEVIWCRKAKNPGLYHTGIKIKDLPTEKIELIEDFLKESSLKDRWLSIIRGIEYDPR
jgi:hypothetical protein